MLTRERKGRVNFLGRKRRIKIVVCAICSSKTIYCQWRDAMDAADASFDRKCEKLVPELCDWTTARISTKSFGRRNLWSIWFVEMEHGGFITVDSWPRQLSLINFRA